jgi:hypothetical protein
MIWTVQLEIAERTRDITISVHRLLVRQASLGLRDRTLIMEGGEDGGEKRGAASTIFA